MLKRAMKGIGALALLTLLLAGCGQAPATTGGNRQFPGPGDDDSTPRGGITQFYTRNVVYRVDEDIVVGMPDLIADLQVKRPNQPLIPANKEDFVVNIHTGNLVIEDAAMTAIFNKYVFNYEGSPLSDLKIANKDGKVTMSGTMHKGIPLPFWMEGSLSPNGAGQLILKPESVKSAGIPVKGIMDVMGLEMAKLINSKAAGVKIDGNNIVIYPDKLLPPPAINGFVTGARVENGRVVMIFDDKVRRPYPDVAEPQAKNYLLMWGGAVLINNHLILDAKLQMIDTTPQDPMKFYMPVYREQLAAGYVVADRGYTIAYVPDVVGTTVDMPRYRPRL
ncbi:hypothetical protein J7643_08920 [bacterium]|nr:hypothetical protein [bacterium]